MKAYNKSFVLDAKFVKIKISILTKNCFCRDEKKVKNFTKCFISLGNIEQISTNEVLNQSL